MNDTTTIQPVVPGPAVAAPDPATPAPAAPAAVAPAAPPDPSAQDADGFTQAERDFFASRGEKTEGLLSATPGVAPEPAAAGAAAPAAAAPAAPAVAGEDDDSDDDTVLDPNKPPPKRVAYGKFKRVQERAKTLEKQLNDLTVKSATDHATLAERVRLINEALTTPKQQEKQEEEDPEPDKEIDIFAHNAWLSRRTAKLEGRLQEFDKRENDRTERATMAERYEADAQTFSSKATLEDGSPNHAAQAVRLQDGRVTTNFYLSYLYLLQNRMEELQRFGMTDQNEIRHTVANEERDLVKRAIASNASPAQRVWDMAIGRGFKPILPSAAPAAAANGAAAPAAAAPTMGTPLGAPAPTNGAAAPAAAAPGAPAIPSVSAEIAAIKAGQGAAFSLSNAAGATGGNLTPEQLANMPQEEFERVLATLTKQQQKELLGT